MQGSPSGCSWFEISGVSQVEKGDRHHNQASLITALLLHISISGGIAVWQDEVWRRVLDFKVVDGNVNMRYISWTHTAHTPTQSKAPRLSQKPLFVKRWRAFTAVVPPLLVLCVPWRYGYFFNPDEGCTRIAVLPPSMKLTGPENTWVRTTNTCQIMRLIPAPPGNMSYYSSHKIENIDISALKDPHHEPWKSMICTWSARGRQGMPPPSQPISRPISSRHRGDCDWKRREMRVWQ